MTTKNDENEVTTSANSSHSISSLDKFIWSFLVCTVSIIVIFGSLCNIAGHKYSRARGYPGCQKTILNLHVSDSLTCCDQRSNWICTASFDSINNILGSYWSLVIPLVPLVITVIADCNNNNYLKHSKRILVYVVIILIRMV